jgi:hypothetical protein
MSRRKPNPPETPPEPSRGKNKRALGNVDSVGSRNDEAKGTTGTSNSTQPPSPSAIPDKTQAEEVADDDVVIRPGVLFTDNNGGFGIGVVLNVVGEDVYAIHGDCDASRWSVSQVRKMLNEGCISRGGPFDLFADHIAALFALHPATAPFTPPKRYRDLPVAPTPTGAAFIKELLSLAGLDEDSDWNVEQVLGDLSDKMQKLDAAESALMSMWDIVKGASGMTWKDVVVQVRKDYDAVKGAKGFFAAISQAIQKATGREIDPTDHEAILAQVLFDYSRLFNQQPLSPLPGDPKFHADPYHQLARELFALKERFYDAEKVWTKDSVTYANVMGCEDIFNLLAERMMDASLSYVWVKSYESKRGLVKPVAKSTLELFSLRLYTFAETLRKENVRHFGVTDEDAEALVAIGKQILNLADGVYVQAEKKQQTAGGK